MNRYTQKQIADNLGTNKQKVYRYIRDHHIKSVAKKGQTYIYDETVLEQIRRELNGGKYNYTDVVELLKQQLADKDRELKAKDKQLATQAQQITASTKLADQAQQLQLDLQQQLKALQAPQTPQGGQGEGTTTVSQPSTQPKEKAPNEPKKRHWWQFGR